MFRLAELRAVFIKIIIIIITTVDHPVTFAREVLPLLHCFTDCPSVFTETIYELLYTPKSEREYGTLACWAKNSIGKQVEPCLFQVVPAGKLLLSVSID